MYSFENMQLEGSPDKWIGEFSRHASLIGFDFWTYNVRVPALSGPTPWGLHNCPADLWQAYSQCNTQVRGPMPTYCKEDFVPCAWIVEPASENTDMLSTHNLMDVARRHGITGGICIPVRDFGDIWGSLTLATMHPITQNDIQLLRPIASLFAAYVHRACVQHLTELCEHKMPRLSPRELECLSWASAGKTSWEIGMLLDISERTVVFHLQNAAAKLGVVGRQHAVAKSITLGILN
ncbi:MAG: Transcriptional regulator, LysR family [Rhodocyclales bacterium]|nr:Transcriptional regulator, LysR family [Rhodocyclales bacterium]MDB5888814.1 Transcriptional regulator, LysR family [Rhodocyclales bacterium]